jgi:hypothetical protein
MIPTSQDYRLWHSRRKQDNEINLTEQEWIDWWTATGQWDNHGTFGHSVVMARIDLEGAYELGNIELITKRDSASRAGKRGKANPK